MIPEDTFDAVKQFMKQRIPFNHFLGMEVTHLGDGDARLEVPFRDELIGCYPDQPTAFSRTMMW